MEGRGQLAGMVSHFLLCQSEELNSGHHAWLQVFFPQEIIFILTCVGPCEKLGQVHRGSKLFSTVPLTALGKKGSVLGLGKGDLIFIQGKLYHGEFCFELQR